MAVEAGATLRLISDSDLRLRLPELLNAEQPRWLLATMEGTLQLIARLLYGTGIRLIEGLRLRVKDVDFERNVITIRGGKGG